MIKYDEKPHIVIVHTAGNDIGSVSTKTICSKVREFFEWLYKLMPETKLVWSQILTWLKWQYSENLYAMDRSRNSQYFGCFLFNQVFRVLYKIPWYKGWAKLILGRWCPFIPNRKLCVPQYNSRWNWIHYSELEKFSYIPWCIHVHAVQPCIILTICI